ncbi:hypothetical protein MD484_g8435, partial [Candolleomyces efflorescens]
MRPRQTFTMSDKRPPTDAPTQTSKKRRVKPAVVRPEPTEVPHSVPQNHQALSVRARREKAELLTRKRLAFFREKVTRFKIQATLEELSRPLTSVEKSKLEEVCDQTLGPSQPAQVMSGVWLDAASKPIFAYFAHRVEGPTQAAPVDPSLQYVGRTERDLELYRAGNPQARVHYDGLNAQLCRIYQLATQALCANMTPNLRMDRVRHEGVNFMEYRGPSRTDGGVHPVASVDGNMVPDHPAYDEANPAGSGVLETETAGVLHLVHGWIQQGQPAKVRVHRWVRMIAH